MKKSLKLSIIIIIAFIVLTYQFIYKNNSIAATTEKQVLEDGVYTIKSALNEKFVLDIYGNLSTDGANVELWTNNQGNNQKFTIKYLSDGTYSITALNSKKSLDVEGNLKKAGTNVLQWKSNNQDNQKWIIKSAGNGYYKIVSKSCNLCLDVPYSKAQNGSNIQVWTDNGGKNQMFKFEKQTSTNTQVTVPTGTKTIEDGTYIIKSSLNNNVVFDIYNNSTKDGANLELWANTGNTNQRFTVKYLNDGTYSITAVNSKKNIDVEENLKKAGTNVLQWTANNQDNQKWIIKDAGSGNYNIISNSCGLYLDIPNSTAKSGANVQVWTGNGGKNQMFKFEKYVAPTTSDVVSDGIYTVRSAASNDNVWDIADNSMIDGGNLIIWGDGSKVNQKFSLKRLSTGYYTISSIQSGKYIDVEGASKANGTNVLQWSYNGADNQLWTIKSTGDGYYNIISKCSGLYMTIYSGNICVRKADGSNNQKFKFDNTNTVPKINTTKYPGYKEKVQALIKKHPNWHFEFLYTGLKFEDVVKGECSLHSRNLVPTSYNGEWVCSTCGTKLSDSGWWYCASKKATAYYMDPRNFLDEINVFQFQNVNQYVEDTCSLDGIKSQVQGTYLQNYASAIYNACRNKKVNAYYIISRLIQEQGKNGTTIGTGMDGGDGKKYYNPFNIGASGNGYSQIYAKALATAKSYKWNTMQKAIEGGIDFCKKYWLDNYQNTLYQNKFDIDTRNGSSLYTHQYMQNLMGAYSEARLLYGMYKDTSKTDEYFTFIIPVYEGMSATTAQAPKNTVSGNTATVKTKDGIGCKVRSKPGTSSEIITVIADGVQVKIIEKGKYNNIDGYDWCKVQLSDGRQGYMPDKFLV